MSNVGPILAPAFATLLIQRFGDYLYQILHGSCRNPRMVQTNSNTPESSVRLSGRSFVDLHVEINHGLFRSRRISFPGRFCRVDGLVSHLRMRQMVFGMSLASLILALGLALVTKDRSFAVESFGTRLANSCVVVIVCF